MHQKNLAFSEFIRFGSRNFAMFALDLFLSLTNLQFSPIASIIKDCHCPAILHVNIEKIAGLKLKN
jgi:hypothetical protein